MQRQYYILQSIAHPESTSCPDVRTIQAYSIVITADQADISLRPDLRFILVRKGDSFSPEIQKAWGKNLLACVADVDMALQEIPFLQIKGRRLIGYYFTQKKIKLFRRDGLLSPTRHLQFVKLGLQGDKSDLPIQLIVHKRNQSGQENQRNNLRLIQNCKQLKVFIDPVVQSRLMLRSQMQLIMSKGQAFKIPKGQLVHKGSKPTLTGRIICKSQQACGTPKSHTYFVIESQDFQEEMHQPLGDLIYASQYIEHEPFIAKLYGLGDRLWVVFFSQENNKAIQKQPGQQLLVKAKSFLQSMKQEGLLAWGLDVIIDKAHNYWAVDLNYMPSYRSAQGLVQQWQYLMLNY